MAWFVPTPPLRVFAPPLKFEVHPVARLREDGWLVVEALFLPAPGPCLLVVWRPGEEPAFQAVRGALRREAGGRWRLTDRPAVAGHVVLWLPEAAPGAPGEGS